MKRLPVYVMTAAIAMTGATTITSQAAVKVIAIGSNGQNCDLSWNQLAGNSFNGIKLPDCDILKPNNGFPNMNRPATPTPDGDCLPDISVPDMNVPAVPDQGGSQLPDIGVPNTPNTPDTNVPETDNSFTAQVVALVNEERAKAGLSPLTVDSKVSAAADTRAREIETSFSHTRPDGSSFSTALTQSGVSYRGAGENIAYGQKTPKDVMNSWMNSQGHRANILNKDFTTIGVGYHQNSNGTGYWTQLFTR